MAVAGRGVGGVNGGAGCRNVQEDLPRDSLLDQRVNVCAVSYADATGGHLPLVATLNAARNFDLGAALLVAVTQSSPIWHCRHPLEPGA